MQSPMSPPTIRWKYFFCNYEMMALRLNDTRLSMETTMLAQRVCIILMLLCIYTKHTTIPKWYKKRKREKREMKCFIIIKNIILKNKTLLESEVRVPLYSFVWPREIILKNLQWVFISLFLLFLQASIESFLSIKIFLFLDISSI